ncbi:cupredoxin domain-containing protein [Jatrophihabitans cynanchi]|jgi:plastocyanin|uniref:Cupredoxin domain-containing protein n=1 Tax=Jatrophihabitans cynanchi TaxID=2944128 RepID=A0ABY7K5E9_9ACTN|nr:cupredoxin domain-containing protein [Jatrophihabitans sp. SB3-54]WAX59190.1 cupredoxin domain-containing protein [Jatrophihabitans sp. SB3-54]
MSVTRSTRAATALAAITLATAGVLAGCTSKSAADRQPHSGSGTASVVDGVQQITLHATDFRFSPSTITVHPGKVRIVVVNDGGGAPHDWKLPDFPADYVPLASNGQTKEATFTAPAAGRYQFVCTIHTKQGMTGTLVVLPS